MKIVAHISGPFRTFVGDEVFGQLLELCPGSEQVFQCHFPSDDQRVLKIEGLLAQAGFHRWEDHSRPLDKKSEYLFSLERKYEPSDFFACSLMELFVHHEKWIKDAWRDDQGRIMLRGRLKKSLHFGMCIFHWYVVPDRVRRLLEKSGLKHITFRETVPMAKTEGELVHVPDWSFWSEPWWELDSDFTLPPLSPSMTFVDRQGKPVKQGDYSNGFHAKEGLYNHAELHYRESDLKGLPQFDLARTAEPSGNRRGYDPFDRPLIASKRFYDVCVENKLNADWIPVRIDSD